MISIDFHWCSKIQTFICSDLQGQLPPGTLGFCGGFHGLRAIGVRIANVGLRPMSKVPTAAQTAPNSSGGKGWATMAHLGRKFFARKIGVIALSLARFWHQMQGLWYPKTRSHWNTLTSATFVYIQNSYPCDSPFVIPNDESRDSLGDIYIQLHTYIYNYIHTYTYIYIYTYIFTHTYPHIWSDMNHIRTSGWASPTTLQILWKWPLGAANGGERMVDGGSIVIFCFGQLVNKLVKGWNPVITLRTMLRFMDYNHPELNWNNEIMASG